MPNTSPSPSLLQRLGLVSTPNPNDELMRQKVEKALAVVRPEMTDVANRKVTSSKDSLIGRMLMPSNAYAITSPWTGNITYSPDMMKDMTQDEIENTIAHELTHSRQFANQGIMGTIKNMLTKPKAATSGGFLGSSYYWNPDELEAFQTEKDRQVRLKQAWPRDPMTGQGDIMLPSKPKK